MILEKEIFNFYRKGCVEYYRNDLYIYELVGVLWGGLIYVCIYMYKIGLML